jgi:hypothetical protein
LEWEEHSLHRHHPAVQLGDGRATSLGLGFLISGLGESLSFPAPPSPRERTMPDLSSSYGSCV